MASTDRNFTPFTDALEEHAHAINALFQAGYDTVIGEAAVEAEVVWVSDAFIGDTICSRKEEEVWEAYQRLCERLHMDEDDPDYKIIIDGMESIQKELCYKMFEAGMRVCAVYPDFWKNFLFLHNSSERMFQED